jgi:hypothetical protein
MMSIQSVSSGEPWLPNKPCLPPTNLNESKDLKTPLSSLLFLFRGAEKKDGKHSPSSAALYMLGRCEEKVQIDSAFRPKAGSCQCVRSLGLGLRWEETWLRCTEREGARLPSLSQRKRGQEPSRPRASRPLYYPPCSIAEGQAASSGRRGGQASERPAHRRSSY